MVGLMALFRDAATAGAFARNLATVIRSGAMPNPTYAARTGATALRMAGYSRLARRVLAAWRDDVRTRNAEAMRGSA